MFLKDHLFIENHYYSKDKIIAAVRNNPLAISALAEFGYIKRNIENRYSFEYVGLISMGTDWIFVLPKYYEGCNIEEVSYSDISMIIQALRIAGAQDGITPDYLNFSALEDSYSELIIADRLIQDYLHFGIYRKEVQESYLDAEGEVDWGKTVDILQPIFSNKSPFYSEYYTARQKLDSSYIITEIHKWAVNQSISRFGQILGYNIVFDEDALHSIETIGSEALISEYLRAELSGVYVDRNIHLLKLLLAFVTKNYNRAKEDFTLFGTGYFHNIWEYACRLCFGDMKHVLNLQMSAPVWSNFHEYANNRDPLRPDIVTINNGIMYVLDAKYYRFRFERAGGTLRCLGNPGINDISKQFCYELSLDKTFAEPKVNALLFPIKSQPSFWQVIGKVEMDIFLQKTVWAIYISADHIWQSFILNSASGHSALPNISAAIQALSAPAGTNSTTI